ITAPAALREAVDHKGTRNKVRRASALRPDLGHLEDPMQSAKYSLRALARRVKALDEEIAELDAQMGRLVARCAPSLIARCGIGTQHAAQLLITAGQNLDRLDSDAAFARLCGVAPIPVSSGNTHRMRLHRGGDRQANRTLHLIVVVRLKLDDRTKAYMRRRLSEGLSKRDAMRCLKRFVAREVFNDLRHDFLANRTSQL